MNAFGFDKLLCKLGFHKLKYEKEVLKSEEILGLEIHKCDTCGYRQGFPFFKQPDNLNKCLSKKNLSNRKT